MEERKAKQNEKLGIRVLLLEWEHPTHQQRRKESECRPFCSEL